MRHTLYIGRRILKIKPSVGNLGFEDDLITLTVDASDLNFKER
jgi:hypothetical protein